VLLQYQRDWVRLALSDRTLIACAKSRRIGISWVDAGVSVLKAIKYGRSTLYTSFNYESGIQYLKDCATWVRFWTKALKGSQFLKGSERDAVLKPVIYFANGAKIKLLPANAASVRGQKGDLVKDEAAFSPDLQESLDAGIALTMWGAQVRVISTHFGEENPFNALVKSIVDRAIPNSGYLEIPLRAAVSCGVFHRITQKNNIKGFNSESKKWELKSEDKVWTEEAEKVWIAELYRTYGRASAQELDVIPEQERIEDALFYPENFQFCEPEEVKLKSLIFVRSWDVAATSKPKTSYYTAGCLIGLEPGSRRLYLLDVRARQLNPLAGEKFMQTTAKSDGEKTQIVVEKEGGSAGLKYEHYFKEQLPGHLIRFLSPKGSKYTRATPAAGLIANGELLLVKGEWNDFFISAICKFEKDSRKTLTNDLVDSLSLGVNYLRPMKNTMLGL
jgi:phage terminase large subunit-like protein